MLERLVSGGAVVSPDEPVPSMCEAFRAVFSAYAVLVVVDRMPGCSSREVCGALDASEGDSLRLLGVLEDIGLLGHTYSFPDAWRLTLRGEEVVYGNRPIRERAGSGHSFRPAKAWPDEVSALL
jgi:hypothetical protein